MSYFYFLITTAYPELRLNNAVDNIHQLSGFTDQLSGFTDQLSGFTDQLSGFTDLK